MQNFILNTLVVLNTLYFSLTANMLLLQCRLPITKGRYSENEFPNNDPQSSFLCNTNSFLNKTNFRKDASKCSIRNNDLEK